MLNHFYFNIFSSTKNYITLCILSFVWRFFLCYEYRQVLCILPSFRIVILYINRYIGWHILVFTCPKIIIELSYDWQILSFLICISNIFRIYGFKKKQWFLDRWRLNSQVCSNLPVKHVIEQNLLGSIDLLMMQPH